MGVRKRVWESKGTVQTAWLVDYRDATGKRRFETHRLKRDADNRWVEIQNEVKAGTHTPIRDSITIGEAAELWFGHSVARKLEQGTLRNYRGHLDRYILPTLGHVKLGRLTTQPWSISATS